MKAFNIASLEPSDGIEESARNKINGNFRNLVNRVSTLSVTGSASSRAISVSSTSERLAISSTDSQVPSVLEQTDKPPAGDLLSALFNAVYPIGSIFMTSKPEPPSLGEWDLIVDDPNTYYYERTA